jgi:3-methyladenine DNA glycosylase AlkD
MVSCRVIQKKLIGLSDKQQAAHLSRFFKTGKGSYGEGDRFRGIRVPQLRMLAKEFAGVPLDKLSRLLDSSFHEDRFFALLLLIDTYRRSNEQAKETIYRFYLDHTTRINNWDLVDVSAHHIVGVHLFFRDRKPLYQLAESPLLWDRRISLIASFHFIRNDEFNDTFKLITVLMNDREDLIQKAMGWMLREIGKRDGNAEENFLRQHLTRLPRTTLRYAIERFPEEKRRFFLQPTSKKQDRYLHVSTEQGV